MGHVAGNFDRDDVMRQLVGRAAIGHVRYATTGASALRNVQPLFAELSSGGFAIAHNGNISNAMRVRRELNRRGSIFQSTSDTEVIIHLVATSTYRTLLDRFIDALKQVEGAYSLVCLTAEGMLACRDPLGIRPLVMGRLGDAYIFASETVALDVIGATYIRSVEPGELVVVSDKGVRSHRPFPPFGRGPASSSMSISRDRTASWTVNRSTRCASRSAPSWRARTRSMPTSLSGARFGRAGRDRLCAAVRHPFELGIIRSHYVGRTFHPAERAGPPPRRQAEAQCQFGADPGQAPRAGRRFDRARHHQPQDRADAARSGRAGSSHADRSPPTRHSCFYGVNTPERKKLLAAQMNVAEMNNYIKATASPSSRSRGSTARSARTCGRSAAPALRCLLHRRLSHPPHRP
jgi:amidophosphoribosyltransferase